MEPPIETPDDSSAEGPDEAPELFAPGTIFGRYRVERCIGAGGMGAVYEALHVPLNKRVALKTLHRGVARGAESRARFLREGVAASRIRHPHVVDVSDVGIEDGVPYMVMAYLEGEDLRARLEYRAVIPVEELADLLLPVVAAVGAAHAAGVVHRDLKPENIFLARTPVGAVHPVVVDFGISRMDEPQGVKALTATASLLGTPHYLAPELAQGSAADARTDQYALGVILYECATGRLPFEGTALYGLLTAIVAGASTPPRALRPELPEDFEALLGRAMARDPAARFDSVYALGCDLVPFASGTMRALWAPVFARGAPLSLKPPGSARPAPMAPLNVTLDAPAAPFAPAAPCAVEAADEGTPPPTSTPGARRAISGPRHAALATLTACALAACALILGRALASARATAARPAVEAARPATYRVTLTVVPGAATMELDDQPAGVGAFSRDLPRDGAVHTLRAAAEGYTSYTLVFRDEAQTRAISLTPLPRDPAARPGAQARSRGRVPRVAPDEGPRALP